MKRGRKPKSKPLEDGEGLLGELLPAKHPLEEEALMTRQCTGKLLRTREPTVYAEIVKCLAANMTVRQIMRLFGIGTHTVLAIAREEKLNVATLKGSLADAMLLGANAFAERAIELADACDSAYEAAGTAKALAETSNLMRGQATVIREDRVITLDANALAKQMAKEAQEMGFERGEFSALAESRGAIEVQPLAGASADNESAVCAGDSEICDGFRDGIGVDRQAEQAGGEGVES